MSAAAITPVALSFFQRATEIDPQFANAYAVLGEVYSNLGEMELAADAFQKGFLHCTTRRVKRRDFTLIRRITPGVRAIWRKRFRSTSNGSERIHAIMAGSTTSVVSCTQLGQSIAPSRTNKRRCAWPGGGASLCERRIRLPPISAASTKLKRPPRHAKAKGANSPVLESFLYQLAFVKGDIAGMAAAANWGVGKAGIRPPLYYQAGTAAYFGSLEKSREFSSRAIAWLRRPVTKKRRPVIRLMPPCARHCSEIPLKENAMHRRARTLARTRCAVRSGVIVCPER